MNQDQVMATVRTILTIIGPLLVTKGIVASSGLTDWTNNIIALVGALLPVGAWVWGLLSHTSVAKIASVNAIDGVKVVSQSAPAAQVNVAPK